MLLHVPASDPPLQYSLLVTSEHTYQNIGNACPTYVFIV